MHLPVHINAVYTVPSTPKKYTRRQDKRVLRVAGVRGKEYGTTKVAK